MAWEEVALASYTKGRREGEARANQNQMWSHQRRRRMTGEEEEKGAKGGMRGITERERGVMTVGERREGGSEGRWGGWKRTARGGC